MSSHLLYDSTTEIVGSPIEISRSTAVYATLGRILCDTPYCPPEAEYTSVNDSHVIWQRYASQLGIMAKIKIPTLITRPEMLQHPSFGSIPEWLGSLTLGTLKDETAIRTDMYESALGKRVSDQTTISELEEKQIKNRVIQSWHELQSTEARYSPYLLAQIASIALLNTTLHQHMHEEKILADKLQLVA